MSWHSMLNGRTPQKAESESSLHSVSLTTQQVEVLLEAVKQSTFKGENAKEVANLIEKFEAAIQ